MSKSWQSSWGEWIHGLLHVNVILCRKHCLLALSISNYHTVSLCFFFPCETIPSKSEAMFWMVFWCETKRLASHQECEAEAKTDDSGDHCPVRRQNAVCFNSSINSWRVLFWRTLHSGVGGFRQPWEANSLAKVALRGRCFHTICERTLKGPLSLARSFTVRGMGAERDNTVRVGGIEGRFI